MQNRYRVFLRPWGVYYCEDLVTKKQETLKTRDKDEAFRLVAAKNENEDAPAFSLHLARVYWKAGDPAGATRTWQQVMDEIPKFKTGETHARWLVAIKDKAFDSLRGLVVLQTQADHFLKVLEKPPRQLTALVGPPGSLTRWLFTSFHCVETAETGDSPGHRITGPSSGNARKLAGLRCGPVMRWPPIFVWPLAGHPRPSSASRSTASATWTKAASMPNGRKTGRRRRPLRH